MQNQGISASAVIVIISLRAPVAVAVDPNRTPNE
jgi:hypothetical protein